MTAEHQTEVDEADDLYSRFVKPLESDHAGEFAAVSKDGAVVLGPTMLDAADLAAEELGPEAFLFKVGEPAVGRWLSLTGA